MLLGWAVLILFPLLDGSVAHSKLKHLSQLRPRELEVDALLLKVFAQGFGIDWILPQLPKMLRN